MKLIINRTKWHRTDEQQYISPALGSRLLAITVIAELVGVNDDVVISEVEREQRLTELFAKHGVEVEFIGEKEE